MDGGCCGGEEVAAEVVVEVLAATVEKEAEIC